MPVRSLRGATTVPENSRNAIHAATTELLQTLMSTNDLSNGNILSAVFSATRDLDAAYPAESARRIGWSLPGLMCLQEMHVVGSLERCLRVLLLVDSTRNQTEMVHCYLGGARDLRPDLAPPPPTEPGQA
jgi:chorismate mutase